MATLGFYADKSSVRIVEPMKTSKEQIQAAIQAIEKFSPAPRILAKALTLLRDPYSDVDGIAKLIISDATLTADVIRCSNSVYYGVCEQRVTTLGQAVQKIGFREMVRLLNLAVSRVMAGRDLGSYGISAEDFWAESLMNGLFMCELAKTTGGFEPDEAYTGGLLRFIGRLAINQSIHDMGGCLFWSAREPISNWEMKNVGMTQAEVGGLLLKLWQFSDEFVASLTAQENPQSLERRDWLAEALHFSSSILPPGLGASFVAKVGAVEPEIPESNEFMERNNLSATSVAAAFAATRLGFVGITRNFGRLK